MKARELLQALLALNESELDTTYIVVYAKGKANSLNCYNETKLGGVFLSGNTPAQDFYIDAW